MIALFFKIRIILKKMIELFSSISYRYIIKDNET